MKTLLKIGAGILVFFILLGIGLNLYFTDERLKSTVMPYVNDATEREVSVESMSLTFFSTFPQPGLSIYNMSIAGDTSQDTLASLEELVVGVKLFSLLGDEISISEIRLNKPSFTYRIGKDSTSNIDFLMPATTEEDTAATEGYAVNIPYFEINDGTFGYIDETSNTAVTLNDFDAGIALRYADLIESSVDIQLGGLSATINGSRYINALPLTLTEKSTINLEQETISLTEGTFSIRGLALNLSGDISDWSSTPRVDLTFNSSSDNFGELLRLVPAAYEDAVKGFETRGTLAIDGSLNGTVGEEEPPAFDISVEVSDGWMKNPDLPKPVENIQLAANISNSEMILEKLDASAGVNTISASGSLEEPLKENGSFSVDINGNIDLSTVSEFVDISEFDIERMGGNLQIAAVAGGERDRPEEADFKGNITLTDGLLKYREVPGAIENISADASGTQDLITLASMSMNAAGNTFSMNGTIRRPLDENERTVDLDTELRFDLATIKEFYPIDEDTLKMSGLLTAQAALKGKADQIERSVESGSINLRDGFISHKNLGRPIEDFNLESVLEGNRLTVVSAGLRTGENNLKASGLITNYLSEERIINLKLEGNAALNEISNYYELSPAITKLTGRAEMNLQAEGQPSNPAEMKFNGRLNVSDVMVEGDSLVQPVHDLNGELNLTPEAVSLESLTFNLGSSDIRLSGTMNDYMEFMKQPEDRNAVPHITGTFKSNYLNTDELIDWQDTTATTEPIPMELPQMTSSVTAAIEKMLVTGVNMRQLEARASTTSDQIKLEQATVELFEGRANGSFVWDISQPLQTNISFLGSLDSLRAETFFEEYAVLGENSKIHNHLSGTFNADVDYYSELDEFLEPVIETTKMDGSFSMSDSRLKDHPLQKKMAALFKAGELRNIPLDEFKSTFAAENSVLTLNDLKLTSGDIGVEMDGTQHLITDAIDYKAKIFLPGRFKNGIASVLSEQAVKALTQENGTILVPLRITGTSENPKTTPDQEAIKPIIKEFLKNKAGNTLKKLFGDG